MKTLLALLSVQAALLTGTPYSGDIHLLGVKEEFGIFKITCFSCLKPYEESADFYINDVQIDAVRYSDGKCYHKRKLCDPMECTCSKEGNNFTLSMSSGLSFMEFSCEMRFKDEATGKLSVQTAHLIFNETEFIPEVQRSRTIGFNENTQTKTDTTDANVIVSDDGQKNNKTLNVVGWILVVFVALVISVLTCIFPNTPGKISNLISRCTCCISRRQYQDDRIQIFASPCYFKMEDGPDLDLYKMFKENKYCSTCKFASVSVICIDCKESFCDSCCVNHIHDNTEHRLCQKQHFARNQTETVCRTCKKLAARFCKMCCELRCTSCFHRHKEMMRIYPLPTVSKTQPTKTDHHKMKHVNTVYFQSDQSPVRIYGIGYLADGTLFALDGSNLKLIVFNSNNEQLTEVFEDEPCAITSMTGHKIAITFPYNRLINIYEIDVNGTKLIKKVDFITMEKLKFPKLKPYSIAYNRNHFAIEVGEREDGIIIIYDYTQSEPLSKINCKLAYFTGHTIRLALDIGERRLYVSAMGKRMVYCMDFNGNIQWDITNASPRSIIIPEGSSFGEKIIILSSRRCNAIYVLNKETGEEIFLHRISSPRYTAYNSMENKLCVHVKNKNTNPKEDELMFLELQSIPKCNSETKLLEMIVH